MAEQKMVKLREVLCDYFSSKGELPVEESNGIHALDLIDENEFDAVLLDIMMPELDGLSVCRAVCRTNDVPIIFLTALSDEEDKLLGYELGADDYVTKPFTMSVLYAKTMALIKRNQRNVLAGDRMEAGNITHGNVEVTDLIDGFSLIDAWVYFCAPIILAGIINIDAP
jgi:DNA-binding response OmpR family regulator